VARVRRYGRIKIPVVRELCGTSTHEGVIDHQFEKRHRPRHQSHIVFTEQAWADLQFLRKELDTGRVTRSQVVNTVLEFVAAGIRAGTLRLRDDLRPVSQ
jgi:hypothetical protein